MLRSKTKKTIKDTALACYDYMRTEVGKEKVLNPPGYKPIMKIDWQPNVFTEKNPKKSQNVRFRIFAI